MTSVEEFGAKRFVADTLAIFSFLSPNQRALLQYHRGAESLDLSKPAFIYTGRGPSNASFHIGHLPALNLCLALQKYFNTPIRFMISDDEKMFRDGIDRAKMEENVSETLEQLARIGFHTDNTQFRINSAGISPAEYELVIRMLASTSVHTLSSIFGEKNNLGEYFYPLIQILPCFCMDQQCVVIAGIDQDPFFRLARGMARKLGFAPPIILYTHSVPGLDGSEKMSTSVPSSLPIFLKDSPEEIAEKVSKIRKVGAGSLDELFAHGAVLDVDVPYRLLNFFDESGNLPLITKAYTCGLTDTTEIATLATLVPSSGIKTRDSRTMMTSFGIRQYLTSVIVSVCVRGGCL